MGKSYGVLQWVSKVSVVIAAAFIIGTTTWGVNVISGADEKADRAMHEAKSNCDNVAELKKNYSKIEARLEKTQATVVEMDKRITAKMAEQTVMLKMLLDDRNASN